MGVAFVRSSSRVRVLRGLLVVPACESVACGITVEVLSCRLLLCYSITGISTRGLVPVHGRAVCTDWGKICSELHTWLLDYYTELPTPRDRTRPAGTLGK